MRLVVSLLMLVFLTSCGPLYYGYLPGTDYTYYQPLEQLDLKGQSYSLEFVDSRTGRDHIECSKHRLNRETELEGDLGFQYFKGYVETMITRSHGVIDPKSPRQIQIRLEGLSFRLVGAFFIVAHGFAQFSVYSPALRHTYCSDMTDQDKDAPLKWYSLVTRKTATRTMVSGSLRRALEGFVKDLQRIPS